MRLDVTTDHRILLSRMTHPMEDPTFIEAFAGWYRKQIEKVYDTEIKQGGRTMPRGVPLSAAKLRGLVRDLRSGRYTKVDLMRRNDVAATTVRYHAKRLRVRLPVVARRAEDFLSTPVTWVADEERRRRNAAINRGDPEVCRQFGFHYVVHEGVEVFRGEV